MFWDSFSTLLRPMTRERDRCLCLCTGPFSSINQITDLEVVEGATRPEEERSTALFNATIKGIEHYFKVMIQCWCSSCHYKQREFVENQRHTGARAAE